MRRLGLAVALVTTACADVDPCALDRSVPSIDEALALVDDLPEPTLTCFVKALARPLGMELTSNTFSLQPAGSRRNPRVLLTDGSLVMSVVPVGEARNLLEFGELLDDGRSLKAELAFPVDADVVRADAFVRTLDSPGARFTSCGVCHAQEVEVAPGEFASLPLRPQPGTLVPVWSLQDERTSCDPAEDPERCAMLAALFDHGPVEHVPLPDSYPF
ncbi:MAG: hypothetical protein AAF211_15895 [Myxococcota bacterium]